MMAEMNLPVTPGTVAGYYGDLIDLFVYDRLDPDPPDGPDLMTYESDILMTNRHDRRRVAFNRLCGVVGVQAAIQ